MAHAFESTTAAARHLERETPAICQARIELAACFRTTARLGLDERICNHFSCVVPGHDDLFLVNPDGLAFAEVTASSLLICDVDGGVVMGEGAPEATLLYPCPAASAQSRGTGGLPYPYAPRHRALPAGGRPLRLGRADRAEVL